MTPELDKAECCSKPGCGAERRIGNPCTDGDCPQIWVHHSDVKGAARFGAHALKHALAADVEIAELRSTLAAKEAECEALREKAAEWERAFDFSDKTASRIGVKLQESRAECEALRVEVGKVMAAGFKRAAEISARAEAAETKLKRIRAETIEECVKRLQQWKRRSHLELHAGEVTAQEFRTVVAVLISIEGEFRALASEDSDE